MLTLLALALTLANAGPDDVIPQYEYTADGAGGADLLDYAYSPALDSAGNVYAVGYVSPEASHFRDGHVVKLDLDGNLLWTRTVDSGVVGVDTEFGDDRLHGAAVDASDTLYVGGTLGSWWAHTTAHQYWYVGSYAPDGTVGFAATWQDGTASAWQTVHDVAIDSDGDLWATGVAFNGWGATQQQWATIEHSATDGAVLRGPWVMNASTSADCPDIAYGIAIDPVDDSVVVVGALGVSGVGDSRDIDWHVIKYAEDGTVLWTDRFGGPSFDNAFDAVIDSNGDVYVVGRVNRGASLAASEVDWDLVVVKYAKDGEAGAAVQLWRTDLDDGVGRSAYGRDVALHPDGSVMAVGSAENEDQYFRYAVVLDPDDGSVTWDRVWPAKSAGSEAIFGVDSRGGRLAVAGYTSTSETDRQFWVEMVELDSDADGTGDPHDGCPFDAGKVDPGVCGCGEPDTDTDADSVPDCNDLCPGTEAGATVDQDGCEIDDPDTDPDTDTDAPDEGGCGCDQGPAGGLPALALALALVALRRRR